MERLAFKAVLIHPDDPGAWTFLNVPFNVQETFGIKGRVSVKGTVNGTPFRSSLMPHGDGSHFLVVNKDIQRVAKAGPGDTVCVELELDTTRRTVDVPEDLASALSGGEVQTNFDKMSYSHKKEYVDWIESAKKSETRARRIEKAVSMIKESKRLKG